MPSPRTKPSLFILAGVMANWRKIIDDTFYAIRLAALTGLGAFLGSSLIGAGPRANPEDDLVGGMFGAGVGLAIHLVMRRSVE